LGICLDQTCPEGKVVEQIENKPFLVVNDRGHGLPSSLVPFEKRERGESLLSDEILVPCNLPEKFRRADAVVKISGSRSDCCNLLTLPNLRVSWGCHFEITSIEKAN